MSFVAAQEGVENGIIWDRIETLRSKIYHIEGQLGAACRVCRIVDKKKHSL
jgi:hypothetical protein